MWKKVGRVIINNFGLKVLAVVFAVIVWLAIVNTVDPEKTVTFTIPIEVINDNYLAEEGKTYEILDNSDVISFTVNGKRSIVENLTADDFRAIANMNQLDESMTMVPITLTPISYNSQLEITRRESYLMVHVEDLVTREFEINLVTYGSPEGDGFVGAVSASPSTLTVTGPESLVDQIETVQASIDVGGAEDVITSLEPIALLDERNNTVESERITMSVTEAELSATIFRQADVPISFKVTGMPAEGYWYEAPVCDVDSIVLEGTADALAQIESLTFVSEALDVDGADSDLSVRIRIADSLPEGVTLAEGQEEDVLVTVPITAAATREVSMPADHLTVSGLAEDLTLIITVDSVSVTLEGDAQGLRSVNATSLTGTIDAADLTVGSYMLTVPLDTDGSFRATATVPVTVQRLVTPTE